MTWKNRKACQQYVGNDTEGRKPQTWNILCAVQKEKMYFLKQNKTWKYEF
jgi:hypothetical protein